MAKVKLFAVDVEITVRRTLYVEARRPGGAEERVMTVEGWRSAMRHEEDADLRHYRSDAKVVGVREA